MQSRFNGPDRTRTCDLTVISGVLYQLSYEPLTLRRNNVTQLDSVVKSNAHILLTNVRVKMIGTRCQSNRWQWFQSGL